MQTLLARPSDAVNDLGFAAELPRLSASLAHSLSHLVDRAAPISFALRGVSHRLQWIAPRAAPGAFECFRFRLGLQTGHAGLDASAAARLMGERRIDLLPRELRCVLWADALHAVAESIESATRLRLDWLPPATDDPADDLAPDAQRAAFFTVQPDAANPAALPLGSGGFVQFDDDSALAALLPMLPASPARPPATAAQARVLDALRLPLPFSLGSTSITLREVRAVRPGDIVSIEDWQSSGSALRVTARAGSLGFTGFAQESRITVHPTRKDTMDRDVPTSALPGDDDAGQLPLDRLDSLEVKLRFEVGELALSLGELRSIRAGHVFDLAQPLNRSPVRILAHGNVLGKGYLVAVGDRLGIRVSEFAPGEL